MRTYLKQILLAFTLALAPLCSFAQTRGEIDTDWWRYPELYHMDDEPSDGCKKLTKDGIIYHIFNELPEDTIYHRTAGVTVYDNTGRTYKHCYVIACGFDTCSSTGPLKGDLVYPEYIPVEGIEDRAYKDGNKWNYETVPVTMHVPVVAISNTQNKHNLTFDEVRSVTIPKTIERIYTRAFNYKKHDDGLCQSAFMNIFVDEDNPTYKSVDGLLYERKNDKLVAIPYGRLCVETYEFPSGIHNLPFEALWDIFDVRASGLYSLGKRLVVDVPSSVEEIHGMAMYAIYIFHSKQPPTFTFQASRHTIVVVPDGCLENYKSVKELKWPEIYEMSQYTSDIPSIHPAQSPLEGIFSVDGVHHTHLRRGLNIIREADGKVRKVIIR